VRKWPDVEFRILGAFEVVSGGQDLTPARPKQRALLAAFLLHPNEVVGLAAGRSETIAVRVDRSLGRAQRLSGRAVLTVTDGLGNTARLSWPIELNA
jgi:hypothetical protein